jgi:hypothetical protein
MEKVLDVPPTEIVSVRLGVQDQVPVLRIVMTRNLRDS